jgi:hypothetical protein
MDHAVAAWMSERITLLALIAVTALVAQEFALGQSRSTPIPRHRKRLLRAYDEQSGEPLESVEVMDVMSGTTAFTTKIGTVSLDFLPDGGSLVRLRKVGYAPLTTTVAISPADIAPVSILMRRSPRDTQTVVTRHSAPRYISPGLHGFEERRRAGLGGQFVDDASLRQLDGDSMSNVLRRFHGATLSGGRFVSTRTGSPEPAFKSRRDAETCGVAVYENGIKRASLAPIDFNKVRVDDYAGVEFYAGTETYPVWISPMDNDGGVLLLWTRER